MAKFRCNRDVPAFAFVGGKEYELTDAQYGKLQQKYHCFDLRESVASQIVMVRVRGEADVKELRFVDGGMWYPGSEHMAMRKDVQKWIDSGTLEIVNLHKPMSHATPETVNDTIRVNSEINTPESLYIHEPSYEWLTSHAEWQRQSVSYVTNCIMLAFQCDIEKANNFLVQKKEEGLLFSYDGKITW